VGEPELIKARYARRAQIDSARYDPLSRAVQLAVHERERALARLLVEAALPPLAERRLLDVGCGSGGDLLRLIGLGFQPENLVGCDLLEERAAQARRRLPQATRVLCGDVLELPLQPESFDAVMQSTVFTSVLDDDYQERLARRLWELVKPGGGVLWYDFVVDNRRNPDVRAVPLRRVRELFPEGRVRAHRVTLAPPLGRIAARIHPLLYTTLAALPPLRTHVLCWIAKP